MRPVLTADEMRAADRATIDQDGVPGAVLMENAGGAVAAAAQRLFPGARRPVVVCGKGNNGGDGFVVARRLRERGALAVLVGSRDQVGGDARTHLDAYVRDGGVLREAADVAGWASAAGALDEADLVIDALLGTGLRHQPEGLTAVAIDAMRRAGARGVPVLAVDLPSGVSSDTGAVPWPAVVATETVTFAAPKVGHVLPPACDNVGHLEVADIGIPEARLAASTHALWLLEAGDAARAFPPRPRDAHKGLFGHVLVIAGSMGKTGAAVLAARSALRAGAGLVTVATPSPAQAMVAVGVAEAMTEGLAATAGGGIDAGALETALALAEKRDAVVLGPGLGADPATQAFVRGFVARCAVPLLVDADGLNALGRLSEAGSKNGDRGHDRSLVLTPHPGEMARLLGLTNAEVQARRLEVAREAAARSGAVVVLKGQRTLIAEPGGRVVVNPTGNPGMATGGTGDVLSGIGGALLARLEAWVAATVAVYLHGVAGDVAARRKGEDSLIAGDVVEALPTAIRGLARSRR